MSCTLDVAVPEMSAGVLTYSSDSHIEPGRRVIVEVQKHLHAGFVLGVSLKKFPRRVKIKPIAGIIDEARIVPDDLWDLAKWSGKICMCGMNYSLRAILPRKFIEGERVYLHSRTPQKRGKFLEAGNFSPYDPERYEFYRSELAEGGNALVLFPSRDDAKSFYASLPESIKAEALLWPSGSVRLWESWRAVLRGEVRIVIGPPGGVFAPLSADKIIVEDEANPTYIIPYTLKISARSLAGHRAAFLGAEFITGGRVPSLKTCLRTHPTQRVKPDRKSIILADIHASRKEEVNGIDGNIPLTFSLIRRTYAEIVRGRNVLWILNRSGESLEVFCEGCGQSVRCGKCGGLMRSVNDGEVLKCRVCGAVRELPEKCEHCGRKFFKGKRPGIEALAKIVEAYYPKVKLYVKGSRKSAMKGLVLSTSLGLNILDTLRPGLVAWLDLDAELWGNDYATRYRVFTSLYRSIYGGLSVGESRKVLVQARRSGMRVAEFLSGGWEKFIADELREREEFMLPPYGYMVEVAVKSEKVSRLGLITTLEDAGLFVLDPGEEDKPFYLNVETLGEASAILEPLSRELEITIRSE
ncbi:MAG: hypothetical protein II954_00490 [Synergistaceae bacterium]|nr:hypothetical protein [Synergistaceae bacterium]